MSEFSAELQEVWNNSKPAAGREEVKGKVNATCESASVSKNNNGNQMAKLVFVIDDGGKYDGRKLWKNQVLASKANFDHAKTDLNTAGIALPADVNGLPDAYKQFEGKRFALTVKVNGSNSETYIDKLIPSLPPKAEQSPKNGEVANPEIPF